MDPQDFAAGLASFLNELAYSDPDDQFMAEEIAEHLGPVRGARTFEEGGYLSADAGIVIDLADGSELQVTVIHR